MLHTFLFRGGMKAQHVCRRNVKASSGRSRNNALLIAGWDRTRLCPLVDPVCAHPKIGRKNLSCWPLVDQFCYLRVFFHTSTIWTFLPLHKMEVSSIGVFVNSSEIAL